MENNSSRVVPIHKLFHKVENNRINKPCRHRSWIQVCYYMTLHQTTEPIMTFQILCTPRNIVISVLKTI